MEALLVKKQIYNRDELEKPKGTHASSCANPWSALLCTKL